VASQILVGVVRWSGGRPDEGRGEGGGCFGTRHRLAMVPVAHAYEDMQTWLSLEPATCPGRFLVSSGVCLSCSPAMPFQGRFQLNRFTRHVVRWRPIMSEPRPILAPGSYPDTSDGI
jgi:hypothetical protein